MKVWIAGNGLVFPNGNASTNRLIEIAKGFEANGRLVKMIPMQFPKKSYLPIKGKYKGINYQFVSTIIENSNSVQTIFNPYFFAKKNSKQLSKIAADENVRCIFCGSSSLYTIYLLYFTSRRLNIKFLKFIVHSTLCFNIL